MRLERISISRPQTDFQVDLTDFRPGFNVIYGVNGAGKSTTWKFLRHSLFGSAETRHDSESLKGMVELFDKNQKATLNWAASQSDRETNLSVEPASGDSNRLFADKLNRLRNPLYQNLYFSCMGDQESLQNLLEFARHDGIDLSSKSLTNRGAELTLKNQLCSRGQGEELQQEQQRLIRLKRDLESLTEKHQREHQRWLAEIQQVENEILQTRTTVTTIEQQLLQIEEKLKAEQLVHKRTQEESCGHTSGLLKHWGESFAGYNQLRLQLERARQVLADLEKEAQRLRSISRQSPVQHLADAEADLVNSLQKNVQQILDKTDACPECGQIHLQNGDNRWHSLRETIRSHSAQLTQWSQSHCGAHCQCETNQLQQANQQQQNSLTAWSKQLQNRQLQLKAVLAEIEEICECQNAGGTLCRCSRHDSEKTELKKLAQQNLDPTGIRTVETLLQKISQSGNRNFPNSSLIQQQKELLQNKAANQQQHARLQESLKKLKAVTLKLEFENQRSEIGSRIQNSESRILQLKQQAKSLQTPQEVVAILKTIEQQAMLSPVLTQASIHLCNHSSAHWRAIRCAAGNHQIELLSAQGEWHRWDRLSSGNQQFVSTMLRLAIAKQYRKQGINFPMLLDDILADHDYEQQQSAIRILSQYASDGQQIIFLTCHQHIANATTAQGAHLQQIYKSGQPQFAASKPLASSKVGFCSLNQNQKQETKQEINRETTVELPVKPRHVAPVITTPQITPQTTVETTTEKEKTSRKQSIQQSDAFELTPEDSIERLPQIGKKRAARLRSIGINTIDDLLAIQSDDTKFSQKSGVKLSRLQRWQSTARLMCCTPGLKATEARLLALCGVRDASSLAEYDIGKLTKEMSRLRHSKRKSARSYSRHHFGRDHAKQWKRQASRRRSYLSIRNSDSRRGSNSMRGSRSSQSNQKTYSERTNRPTVSQQERSLRSERESTRTPRAARTERKPRIETTSQNRSSQSRSSQSSRTKSKRKDRPQTEKALRFYLSRDSNVVDAPSIGPKTATRLNKVGIITVNDLLTANVESVASQLDVKHITADTLREWQAQARLICCVPEIRGHDAQILVACGIDEVNKLAKKEASELLKVVIPFSGTTHGKRILRSGKKPDLEEVSNWISWSHQSRTLDAA